MDIFWPTLDRGGRVRAVGFLICCLRREHIEKYTHKYPSFTRFSGVNIQQNIRFPLRPPRKLVLLKVAQTGLTYRPVALSTWQALDFSCLGYKRLQA